MKYRAEIDGLRALAVVPVILFHAGFEAFGGGFVGVDVFFVISGYLITTILIEDIENDRLSLLGFYERRARRILPALFFVMLACIPFAWAWMLPNRMVDFSESLVAVSLFGSNFLFWQESGYFEAAAEEKPLLHTWSLAVEEQYYLVFPLLLLLTWRFGKNRVFWLLVAMAALSLVASELSSRKFAAANFYLAPTRVWELFAGSIAAFIVQARGVQKSDTLAMIGLAAIVFSIVVYDAATPFPGIYAVLPVMGTVLLVLYAKQGTLVTRLLSTRVLVGLGLISYSAYLWHQPLFAFARIRSLDEPAVTLMLCLSLLSLLLAIVSWKFVERPFRERDRYSARTIFSLSLVGIVAFVAVGLAGQSSNGFSFRYGSADLGLIATAGSNPLRGECHLPHEAESLRRDPCVYFGGPSSVAVLGNSHGVELAYALATELEPYQIAITHHTISQCRHNFQKDDEADNLCHAWHQKVVAELVEDEAIETIVLSYRHEAYLSDARYRKSLIEMSEAFVGSAKTVVVVLQAPLPGAHINKYVARAMTAASSDLKGISRSQWEQQYRGKRQLLEELPDDVHVIDPAEMFCDDSDCFVIQGGLALYFDDDHMSVEGAKLIADVIVENHIER